MFRCLLGDARVCCVLRDELRSVYTSEPVVVALAAASNNAIPTKVQYLCGL